jgi:hypothetical protein
LKGNRNIDPAFKEQYLEWLMTPKGEREPATKEAMAEKLGVNSRTLWYWEKQPEFQAQMRKLKQEWGSRWYPDILARLMDIVENGPPAQSVQAAKTLLQHLDLADEDKKKKTEKADSEAIERFKAALKENGFAVLGDEE